MPWRLSLVYNHSGHYQDATRNTGSNLMQFNSLLVIKMAG